MNEYTGMILIEAKRLAWSRSFTTRVCKVNGRRLFEAQNEIPSQHRVNFEVQGGIVKSAWIG
jgi:hypothetical protein